MTVRQKVRYFLRKYGIDVSRAKPSRQDLLERRLIDTVIDVGANEGGFADEIRSFGYRGRIISFEPILEIYAKLSQRFQGDPLWKGYNLGISSSCGRAEIGVSEYNVFSSLHPLNPTAANFHEQSKVVRRETIELTTLDILSPEIEGERLFLKIDTQGHEKACLEGLGKLLPRIHAVQLELPISNFYQDTWDMGDGIKFMKQLGFVPCIFSPVNFHGADPIAMVEVDCIFRRYDPAID